MLRSSKNKHFGLGELDKRLKLFVDGSIIKFILDAYWYFTMLTDITKQFSYLCYHYYLAALLQQTSIN